MNSIEQDFNLKFLNKMEKDISEINNNISKLIQNLLELQDAEYDKKLLNEINIFKEVLEKKRNEKNYFQDRQDYFDVLNQKFKDYYESILKIYENDYIKKIKYNNQDLKYYINNINLSESKDSSENISTNQESDKDEEKRSLSLINGFESYINNLSINDSYSCSVCPQEKAVFLCDKCNQLFCKGCLDLSEKYDKNPNKCKHNIQNINLMKESHKKGEVKFLNSLKNFFKRIILKSNYLLNEQSENICAYDINRSKINHIKKYLFEYPIIKDINNINDSTELNFLISINNILVKTLFCQK